jgi:3-hydroxyacyl-CoA dehydrogenase
MKQNRHINKVAVIGSGIMGSRIACHFANIGVEVLLLDIVPFDLTEEQLKDKKIRNSIVNDALKNTLKSKPSPIYSKDFTSRITTGNLDDDLKKFQMLIGLLR